MMVMRIVVVVVVTSIESMCVCTVYIARRDEFILETKYGDTGYEA